MGVYHFICDRGHKISLKIHPQNYNKFLKLCEQKKRVCTECKPENIPIQSYDPQKIEKFAPKQFVCRYGHITEFFIFKNGGINMKYGSHYENFEVGPEEILESIKNGKLKCWNLMEKKTGIKQCNCKLKPVDDTPFEAPNSIGFKIKTRVGDIWDKNRTPEPIESHYQTFRENGQTDVRFVETEFSRRNKERLKRLKKQRISKPAGEILEKPTDRSYRDNNPKKPKEL